LSLKTKRNPERVNFIEQKLVEGSFSGIIPSFTQKKLNLVQTRFFCFQTNTIEFILALLSL
jgi:hypothetical protein